ncbi:hypothetical protein [Ancylobacter lacus]|uniref:hypothetical protein n=1 Tax=Ancylobacter lacus TaxID=2579970 RepID=UPI001BCEB791|nr:hypothetical protein [Ancylobacter lacus]MBS7540911.1 hypothetical protein [Ancylobacter lacus]
MRRLLLAAVLAAAPLAASVPVALAHEADRYTVLFCTGDIAACEKQRAEFRQLVKSAYRNDLNAQRAVARALWRGTPVVPPQWQDGCAWHMTITALRPKGLTEADFENMKVSCSLLREDQIALARNEAQRIGHRILAGGKIDESVSPPPSKRLDATAEPL